MGFIPYVKTIFQGKTKPVKSTWLVYAVLDTIIFAGMYFEKAVNGQIASSILCASTVFFLSLKYGKSGWTKIDIFALVFAAIGIVLWVLFDDPILCLGVSLSVLFAGSIPTFISVYYDSSREDKLSWTIFEISAVFALLGVPKWTFADAATPTVFFLIETIMMYLLYINPKFHKSTIY